MDPDGVWYDPLPKTSTLADMMPIAELFEPVQVYADADDDNDPRNGLLLAGEDQAGMVRWNPGNEDIVPDWDPADVRSTENRETYPQPKNFFRVAHPQAAPPFLTHILAETDFDDTMEREFMLYQSRISVHIYTAEEDDPYFGMRAINKIWQRLRRNRGMGSAFNNLLEATRLHDLFVSDRYSDIENETRMQRDGLSLSVWWKAAETS